VRRLHRLCVIVDECVRTNVARLSVMSGFSVKSVLDIDDKTLQTRRDHHQSVTNARDITGTIPAPD
jgi:hypothetical protein